MYESKKQSAQRTIEKKDSKLQEIETVRSSFKFVFWLQYTAHGGGGVETGDFEDVKLGSRCWQVFFGLFYVSN